MYAELSIAYATIEQLEVMLAQTAFEVVPIPRGALFPAGKAFMYRQTRRAKSGVLPDFFFGAHAAVAGVPLLTRDARRHKAYFPKPTLVSP